MKDSNVKLLRGAILKLILGFACSLHQLQCVANVRHSRAGKVGMRMRAGLSAPVTGKAS